MELVSQPKYFKYSQLEDGDVLIENGKYLETKEGRFGAQHYFLDSDGERKVLNSAGQLNYLVETHLERGTKCKIVFGGKEVLEKGPMAGKEANQFELYLDKNQAPAKQQEMPMATTPAALDDLE